MSNFVPANSAQAIPSGPIVNRFGLPFRVAPTGEMMVQTAPHPRLNETFDSGAWDTINRWVITNGGGGVLPSAVVGQATLNSGTTANGFSKATTLSTPAGGNSFKLTEPGYHLFADRINFESPLATSGYRFFGSGTTPASPTIATPMTQGMGWEVTTGGIFTPVVYQTGTRVAPGTPGGIILTDSFAQPSDINAHKYYRWFRGDIGFWAMDDPTNVVAYYLTGAGGPDINSLPLLYLAVSNGSPAVQLLINGLSVSDTADTSSAVLLNNGFGYDEKRSNLDANTSLTALAAQGTGTVNSADQLNINGRGVMVVVNITVITAGSLTVTIQGKDIASGVYYTLLASAALTTTGTTLLTVYPSGVSPAVGGSNSLLPLPRTWRISSVVATGPVTATVGASVIF